MAFNYSSLLLFNNVAELISFLSVTLSHCSMVSFYSSYTWIQFYISILLAQMLTVAFRFYMLRHQSVLSSAQLVHMYRQSGNNVSMDFLAAAAAATAAIMMTKTTTLLPSRCSAHSFVILQVLWYNVKSTKWHEYYKYAFNYPPPKIQCKQMPYLNCVAVKAKLQQTKKKKV